MKHANSVNSQGIRRIYAVILLISILCIILSITIQIEKKQYELNQVGICSAITGNNGCEAVQTSAYSSMGGIDNPIYGMIGFSLLAIFSMILLYKDVKILKYMIIIGSLTAGTLASWFLYLQAFVLHRYCIFCVIVDISSLVLVGISIYISYDIIKHRHR